MPRTSVRQEPSSAASSAQSGAWSDDGPAFAMPLAMWLDLTVLDRMGLTHVLRRYIVPLEVITYFQLRFRSPKVIAVDRAFFLVTWVVAPSPRQLFGCHELKLCVTPTLVAGLYDRVLRTQPRIGPVLSQPPDLPSGGVTQFVWDVLDGVVTSYETAATTILNDGLLARKGTADLRVWKQRAAALAELVGQQRVLLRNVAHAGRTVGIDEQHEESTTLDTRLERLTRIIGDMRPTAQDISAPFDTFGRPTRSTP